jgi:protoporphyrinogen oxidase
MIAIIGAGLAGLSAAFDLKGRELRIFEQEDRPGGLCRTEVRDGFGFDHGGHLLHFRDPRLRDWVKELLGDNWTEHERRAAIFSQGVVTPYPFQVNTFGLPRETVQECVVGFIQACLQAEQRVPAPEDFAGWVLHTFGPGFARRFFFPFNEKLWQRDLRELTADWVSWSIPRPSVAEVVAGAIGLETGKFGYNPTFLYPRQGGIESLPRALSAAVGRVETNRQVIEVHPKEKELVLENGERVRYRKMIATLPLPELIRRMRGLPEEIEAASRGLKHVSVLCLNLGFSGPPVSDRHWIYFPEPKFRFYRADVYSSYHPGPPDRSALALEISLRPEELAAAQSDLLDSCLRTFQEAGWIQAQHQVIHRSTIPIPYAYVVYDRHRQKHLPKILAYLRSQEIYPAGRYACWEYGTMTDALGQGRAAAAEVGG